jgi:hypothetical protein
MLRWYQGCAVPHLILSGSLAEYVLLCGSQPHSQPGAWRLLLLYLNAFARLLSRTYLLLHTDTHNADSRASHHHRGQSGLLEQSLLPGIIRGYETQNARCYWDRLHSDQSNRILGRHGWIVTNNEATR